MDQRESEWTSMDAPQTVVKAAGLTSVSVHQCPLKIAAGDRESANIHNRPPRLAGLAVILAVESRHHD